MTDNNTLIETATEQLWTVWQTGTPCQPIRSIIGDKDLESAYAVQNTITQRWQDMGKRLVGRKIGLTSKAVQTQLGVDQPDYGALFADMAVTADTDIDRTTLQSPKVEGEIAFVLHDDLTREHLTMVDILGAVAYALPAIEIVDSRIVNWDIKITDTIADNGSSGLFVLGTQPKLLADIDLELCGAVMQKQGMPVSVGVGRACLGNPLNAVLWLAQTMVQQGSPLRAGDVILSGALGPMVPANTGDRFELNINGLGTVRANFA